MTTATFHSCLARFPGAALEMSRDGVVRGSNGLLDRLVGRDLTGVPFAEVLDSSSQERWRRILAEEARRDPARTWELVVVAPNAFHLRNFLALWSDPAPDATLWLLEYEAEPRLERLYEQLADLNGELVEAQRSLRRERNRLARALERAESAIRSRDDVLAVVSHDLRNPVNTIVMAAGLLETPITDEEKLKHVEIVKRAADRMDRLIADLLDVSAIESGRFRVETEPLSLNELLDEACRMFADEAAERGQRLQCDGTETAVTVDGDRDRLLQVLSNLIGNAIKFTPEGGRVTLMASQTDDTATISVRDSGPGIPPDDLPHIFDRFWHGKRAHRSGAGLGLAIAKGIVEAHGGTIRVESEAGEGTLFTFTLPEGADGKGGGTEESTTQTTAEETAEAMAVGLDAPAGPDARTKSRAKPTRRDPAHVS